MWWLVLRHVCCCCAGRQAQQASRSGTWYALDPFELHRHSDCEVVSDQDSPSHTRACISSCMILCIGMLSVVLSCIHLM